VLGAGHPLNDGQQHGEQLAGPGRIPRLPGPAGEATAGGQGVGVLGAGHPLADGQQHGVLVAGPGRIPRLPGPAGEATAGGQGVRVLGPNTRCITGSSAAFWSQAAVASSPWWPRPAGGCHPVAWIAKAEVPGLVDLDANRRAPHPVTAQRIVDLAAQQ
jgi:hypothetical protein